MRISKLASLLEQQDPNTVYVIGDQHGRWVGSRIQPRELLARDGAKLEQIATQAQSVPDNSVVVMTGGANGASDTAHAVLFGTANKIIKGLRGRGCVVIYVLMPMINLQDNQPSAVRNPGDYITVNGKPVTQRQLRQMRRSQPNLVPQTPDFLPVSEVYKRNGVTPQYNRAIEHLARVDANTVLKLSGINAKEQSALLSTADSYASVAGQVPRIRDAEIRKRSKTDNPIGSNFVKGGSGIDTGGFAYAGDMFGIFGSAMNSEFKDEEIVEPGSPEAMGNVDIGNANIGAPLTEFVRQFEGYGKPVDPNKPKGNVKPFWDVKQWSIGFGSYAGSRDKNKPPQLELTPQQADKMFKDQLTQYIRDVQSINQQGKYNWNDNQLKALVSFHYNTGLIKQLTDNATRTNQEIAAKLPEYNKMRVGGQLQPAKGLTRRRAAERAAFLQGMGVEGVTTNKSSQPLLSLNGGESRLTSPAAGVNINNTLNLYRQMMAKLDFQVPINDAIAKAGTSRERKTRKSQHFHGNALDLGIRGLNDTQKRQLLMAALSVGFTGFGFGNNILHVDTGRRRSWDYGVSTWAGVDVKRLKQRVSTA